MNQSPIPMTYDQLLRAAEELEPLADNLRLKLTIWCSQNRGFRRRRPKTMRVNSLLNLLDEITRHEKQ